jgi:hypothetical protein
MKKKMLLVFILVGFLVLVVTPLQTLSAEGENPFQAYRDSFFFKYCDEKPTKDPILATICWLLIEKDIVNTSKTLMVYDSSVPKQTLGLLVGAPFGSFQVYSEDLGLIVSIDATGQLYSPGNIEYTEPDCQGEAYVSSSTGTRYTQYLYPVKYTGSLGVEQNRYYTVENPNVIVSATFFSSFSGDYCSNYNSWYPEPPYPPSEVKEVIKLIQLPDIPDIYKNIVPSLWIGTE